MSSQLNQNKEETEFSKEISLKRQDVLGKYKVFQNGLEECEIKLQNLLLYQKFCVSSNELESWLSERMTQARDISWIDKSNLQVYVQKHSSLEAEVNANEASLTKLKTDGANIVDNNLPQTADVQTRLMDIEQQWQELLDALKLRAKKLSQAINLTNYLKKSKEILYWIQDKETLIKANQEEGKNLHIEDVMLLNGKFEKIFAEINTYQEVIDSIKVEVKKLVEHDKHPENKQIIVKEQEIIQKWNSLKETAASRKLELKNLIQVQSFKTDVEEAISWMGEKEELLRNNSNVYGDDVMFVERLQRRHEAIERDLNALNNKVNTLLEEADNLENLSESRKSGCDVIKMDDVKQLVDFMMLKWEEVSKMAANRRINLDKCHRMQKFLFDCNELKLWCTNIKNRMTADTLECDVIKAEALKEKHNEHLNEINAQEGTYNDIIECGKFIISDIKVKQNSDSLQSLSSSSSDVCTDSQMIATESDDVISTSQINDELEIVQNLHGQVIQLWEERNQLYDQCLHFSLFTRDLEQAQSWLTNQERILSDENLGYSLDSTEEYVKKHQDFIKSVQAQEDKINTVNDLAVRLFEKNHYAKVEIEEKRLQLLERHAKLKQGIVSKDKLLGQMYELRLYDRDVEQIVGWIQDKMIVANDISYTEEININEKLQRHRMFEVEVQSSWSNVESVIERKVQEENEQNILIKKEKVENLWSELIKQSKAKGKKLEECSAEQTYNNQIEDIEDWMNGVHKKLASFDEGYDVPSVTQLVKNYHLLEVEVQMYKDKLDGIIVQAKTFEEQEHFNCKAIKAKQADLAEKYQKLQDPLEVRQTNLSNSLKSKLLLSDIVDENEWISEKHFLAASPYIGKDLSMIGVVTRKHDLLRSEIYSHKTEIEEIKRRAQLLIYEENKDKEKLVEQKLLLEENFAKLMEATENRRTLLNDAAAAADYIENKNDSKDWINEKRRIMNSYDAIKKNEDSVESLKRKHDALLNDLLNYSKVVESLKKQAESCKLQSPMKLSSSNEIILVVHDYRAKNPRELSCRENDKLSLISAYNKNWWKVENDEGKTGFVPSTHVSKFNQKDPSIENESENIPTLNDTQSRLENLYEQVLKEGKHRSDELQNLLEKFALLRDCDENLEWLARQKSLANQYMIISSPTDQSGDEEEADLEKVEKLQRQLEDFQRNVRASGKKIERLNERAKNIQKPTMNTITSSRSSSASSVSSLKQNEHLLGDEVIVAQIEVQPFTDDVADKIKLLNEERNSLEQLIEDLDKNLGSAHQVQRFFRDAEDTAEWIEEKNCILDQTDVGNDLQTVQALQRKHEGLERELAALDDRIHQMDQQAANLSEQHPDQKNKITSKQTEINQAWNDLVEKSKLRKRTLSDSLDLYRFLANYDVIKRWITSLQQQLDSIEITNDISSTEALLHRHQECRMDIDGKTGQFAQLEQQADSLIQTNHSNSNQIDDVVQEVSRQREEIEKSWASKHVLLEQCLKFHHFFQDCTIAENWMQSREDFLKNEQAGDSLDSVEKLIKKHEDFDRAINIQETKISSLNNTCDKLLNCKPSHYAHNEIDAKMKTLQERWEKLKTALIEKRNKLGESHTLQQFSRDADEFEGWICDKLQYATSTHESKHQKYEAFKAELDTNKERMKQIMKVGEQLINSEQLPSESQSAIRAKIDKLESQWDNLIEKSKEKGLKLENENKKNEFVTSVKDINLWISEVETLLDNKDLGKDLSSVEKLLKKQDKIEDDVVIHDDVISMIGKNVDTLKFSCETPDSESENEDQKMIREKRRQVDKNLSNLKKKLKKRRTNLQLSLKIYQFLYEVTEEESWINEKKLITSNKDCGIDLTSCSRSQKKHKRIENEIEAHQQSIERIKNSGQDLKEEILEHAEDDNEKLKQIDDSILQLIEKWDELNKICEDKNNMLKEAYEFQKFKFDADEEISWLVVKMNLFDSVSNHSSGDVSPLKLLNKFQAFHTDLNVHHDKIDNICTLGRLLIEEKNSNSDQIEIKVAELEEKEKSLKTLVDLRILNFKKEHEKFQFNWKTGLIVHWIEEKLSLLKFEQVAQSPQSVKNQASKMETFEASLKAFESEDIQNIKNLKENICNENKANSVVEIENQFDDLMNKWKNLMQETELRKKKLKENKNKLKEIDDLYLRFAKSASGFNSWFENVEEDLTDPIKCYSLQEISVLIQEQNNFKVTLKDAKNELDQLEAIDYKLDQLGSPGKDADQPNVSTNPYTWFTQPTLADTWTVVQKLVNEKDQELKREEERQKENENLRIEFAACANHFHDWLHKSRVQMLSEEGTLEAQLESMKELNKSVQSKKSELVKIEELGTRLEEKLIFDNTHTEHGRIDVAQKFNQLEQLNMRMQHNLEEQIQVRNMTGVSEDTMNEFSIMFKHFDKNQTGKLEHEEFRSCLRSLGYDLRGSSNQNDEKMSQDSNVTQDSQEVVSQENREFQAILDIVDPNHDGFVSLQEYMSFMISRETENVTSMQEVENAFKALSEEGKPYLTKQEIYQNMSKAQADFCVKEMKPYYDKHGIEMLNAFDYVEFTKRVFSN